MQQVYFTERVIKMSDLGIIADCVSHATWAGRFFGALYNHRVINLLKLGYVPTWDAPSMGAFSVTVNVNSYNWRAIRAELTRVRSNWSDSNPLSARRAVEAILSATNDVTPIEYW